ncbi:MAG: SMC-Scp complex subunit ScpB, partial [Gammaproteobacteria bacterium]
MSELTELKRIIEGAILASESPLTIDNLESLFIVESPTRSEIRDAIAEIEADCESRGFELKKVATGYRFQVKEKYSEWVSRLWEERAPRYTRALLETLALIAYKQPITRGDIEEIRGVAVSTNIIRTLLEREWVRVVGHRDVPGRPAMYATTKHFLDYFNVASLEELPTLQEIKDIAAEEASLAIEEPLIEMTSIELEPEDLELEGANETDLDAVSQQVDQIQENIRQVMAPRPEERDEDWDDLESGDPRGEQSGEVSPMESEEGLPADQRADQRA